jgi:hypothetical protein
MPKEKKKDEFAAFENLFTTILATTREDLQKKLDEAKRIKERKRTKNSPASREAV